MGYIVERSCESCVYYDTDRNEQPCCYCIDGENFEESGECYE